MSTNARRTSPRQSFASGDVSDLLPSVNLPDLILRDWGAEAVHGLKRDQGGLIRDRRPGQEEKHASFSVFRHQGVWFWKRHGGDDATGTAYHFLLACGWSKSQAFRELQRLAGVQGSPAAWPLSQVRTGTTSPSALGTVREKLKSCSPLTPGELSVAARLASPLTGTDEASEDLRRRGLLNWSGIKVGKLRSSYQTGEGKVLAPAGALCLTITGPDGAPWGVKIRNLGAKSDLAAAGLHRYAYRLAGHGAPAWCSPDYGQGRALLIVEGEFNAAAASRALQAVGRPVDVQGLAGGGGLPHLDGMADRTVYLYADPDTAGIACLARTGQIATEAGATEVRVVSPLAEGQDFCDELGRLDAENFGRQLTDRLTLAETWQPAIRGNSGLPQNKPALRQEQLDSWQGGSSAEDWTFEDSGWDIDRGGW